MPFKIIYHSTWHIEIAATSKELMELLPSPAALDEVYGPCCLDSDDGTAYSPATLASAVKFYREYRVATSATDDTIMTVLRISPQQYAEIAYNLEHGTLMESLAYPDFQFNNMWDFVNSLPQGAWDQNSVRDVDSDFTIHRLNEWVNYQKWADSQTFGVIWEETDVSNWVFSRQNNYLQYFHEHRTNKGFKRELKYAHAISRGTFVEQVTMLLDQITYKKKSSH